MSRCSVREREREMSRCSERTQMYHDVNIYWFLLDPEDITGMDLMEVILSKEDRNNGLDIPPPIYSSRPTNENQSRNPNVDHNTPDKSQGGQFEAASGPSPQETSESEAKEKTQKNQDKGNFNVNILLFILILSFKNWIESFDFF